jgi:magnesium transporter
MTERSTSESASDQVRRIHAALEDGRALTVRRSLHALSPSEVALLIESLPPGEREVVWGMVDADDRGEVLLHLADEVREGLIEHMGVADIIAVARDLEIDDLADFIEDLPETVTRQVLRAMDERDRNRLEQVLAYDPDTAGGLMNPDTVTVRPDVTLEVVQRYLRLRGELPENTDCLYVVDRYGRYLGALPLDKLLTLPPDTVVHTAMDRNREALVDSLPAREVAKRFENLDLVSAPVTAEDNTLVGRITIDDVVDVIRDESEQRLMRMAGLNQEEDIFAPVRTSARRRAVWLGINLVAALLAARVIGFFEASIAQLVALAVLMPIVASMGGICGNQIVALMVRGLAVGQIGRGNLMLLFKKELAVALLNGLLWALVIAAVVYVWFDNAMLSLVIGMALAINLGVAAVAGVTVPLLVRTFGADPALASPVIVTTATDVMGFFVFLGLGALILL